MTSVAEQHQLADEIAEMIAAPSYPTGIDDVRFPSSIHLVNHS